MLAVVVGQLLLVAERGGRPFHTGRTAQQEIGGDIERSGQRPDIRERRLAPVPLEMTDRSGLSFLG